MKKPLCAIGVAVVIALSVAHCSGCALIVPEGTMTMEVSDVSAE